jgi:hypothetical protein
MWPVRVIHEHSLSNSASAEPNKTKKKAPLWTLKYFFSCSRTCSDLRLFKSGGAHKSDWETLQQLG